MKQLINRMGNTRIEFPATNKAIVSLYFTPIVTFNPLDPTDTITLNTKGYFTITTKRRMNQVSDIYGLGFHVTQRKWDWYVSYKEKEYKFENQTLELNSKS